MHPPSVEEFRLRVLEFIAAARASGDELPPDYGAIIPEEHVAAARRWQRRLFDSGYAGLGWPVEYGGHDLPVSHQVAFTEEMALAGLPASIALVPFNLVGPTLMTWGNDDQKTRHLPPILRGDLMWCQLFSEPGAGSDLASLSTRAIPDGGDYVVSGQKVWTSGAQYSEWGILMVRTDIDAPKHRGISYFLVDMASPGITIRPLKQMTGSSEFNEVFLDEVRIPAENLVGPENDGWRVAMTTLTFERGSIGGASVSMKRGLGSLVGLARETGAADDPVARDAIAQQWMATEVLRLTGERVLAQVLDGGMPGPEASTLKLAGTETGWRTAGVGVAVSGANSLLETAPWTRRLLGAPGGRIAGGSSEVQRNIIGERVLGLPKEPSPKT